MGNAAHVALMMALCQQRFSATQYAAAVGAVRPSAALWVGPAAGVLAASIGWPSFFVLSTVVALPGLALMLGWRAAVQALDAEDDSRDGTRAAAGAAP